uniref:Putative membrane protein n=1 Tax=Corethrella appendiculata TaxID=1370023 RepID=U5EL82_9DIPT
MWWYLHIFWLVIVILLFLLVLRKIYLYQPCEVIDENPTVQNSRNYSDYCIYTINVGNNDKPPPYNLAAPPSYDEVVSKPNLYNKV